LPQKPGRNLHIKGDTTMQRYYKFLIVCLLMLCVHFTKAQNLKNIFADSLTTVIIKGLAPKKPPYFFVKQPIFTVNSFTKSSIIPCNYYTQNFGIICKKELQFQNKTAFPLFFRLGSLEYVNRMEGKR
jgi:hypothetical protein